VLWGMVGWVGIDILHLDKFCSLVAEKIVKTAEFRVIGQLL
jgi:hypothetical protein